MYRSVRYFSKVTRRSSASRYKESLSVSVRESRHLEKKALWLGLGITKTPNISAAIHSPPQWYNTAKYRAVRQEVHELMFRCSGQSILFGLVLGPLFPVDEFKLPAYVPGLDHTPLVKVAAALQHASLCHLRL